MKQKTKSKSLLIVYMPYTIRKVRNKKCYRVTTSKTKRVLAKCTTMEKAKKQVRLLRALEVNKEFAKKVRATRKKRKISSSK
tara:strand:- start:1275 stop:1520 length:246 start_codon:yes stop_codon:yes gene_type:complete